jgi:hypothetical protein
MMEKPGSLFEPVALGGDDSSRARLEPDDWEDTGVLMLEEANELRDSDDEEKDESKAGGCCCCWVWTVIFAGT